MFRIVQKHPKLLKMIKVIQDGSNQFKMNNTFTNNSKYSKLLRIFQTLIKFSKWFQTCLMLLDKYLFKSSTLTPHAPVVRLVIFFEKHHSLTMERYSKVMEECQALVFPG